MYYRMYLSSVCNRRQWPEPQYEHFEDRRGHHCKVRVNNREYSTEVPYADAHLAQENAAMQAYLICRNFSYNDGMYPGQRPGQSLTNGSSVQGLPVAIGTGRRHNRSSYGSSNSDGSSGSGGTSPESIVGGFEDQITRATYRAPAPAPGPVAALPTALRKPRVATEQAQLCRCRRGYIRNRHSRCDWCLMERS